MEDYFWITVPKKLKEFRLRFNVYDRDANGVITVDELLAILREMGQNVTKVDLYDMMAAVDLGAKNDIHFDEFLMMVANKEAREEHVQELRDAFKVFDNGKGFISVKDLRTIMLNMGERLTDEEVDEMIEEANVKDGKIKISGKYIKRLTDREVDEMIEEANVKDGKIKISEFITVLCR